MLEQVLPKLELHTLASNLLRLLIARGRFDALGAIVDVLTETVDERAGRVLVRVTTAEPLSPQLEMEVRAAFEKSTGKTVRLEALVDPALLVARVGGRVYDSSVRTRLEDLQNKLIRATPVGVA